MTTKNQDPRQDFLQALSDALNSLEFSEVRLSKYRGTADLVAVRVTPTALAKGTVLTFIWETKTQTRTQHVEDPQSACAEIEALLGKDFGCATIFGATQDLTLDYSRKGVPVLHKRAATRPVLGPQQHDRAAHRHITPNLPYLFRLGICTAEGTIRPRMAHKFHQIQKFLEIVESRIAASTLAEKKELTIYDFGAGKSYLTFALYEFLSRDTSKAVTLTAIEQRAELAAASALHAKELDFERLHVIASTIQQAPLKHADLVVALHACDTATDDTILRAVEANATLILLAPCCQRWLRARMTMPDPFAESFRHGILEEHFAVLCTEALRASYLESKGYEVSVFEFVDQEHSDKNIMIAATKRYADGDATQYQSLKDTLKLSEYYLDGATGSTHAQPQGQCR